MTNPTPRPALRKAEDATVHPAAPRPARTPRPATKKAAPAPVVEPAAVPAAAPAAAAEKPRVAAKTGKKKRKFGGATSDHLRPEPAADVPAPASRKVSSPSKPAAAPAGKPSAKGTDDLMKGKQVDVDVQVPKALRKAAAKRAKSEGLDLQTVVIDALHAYVTAPPR